MEKYKILLDQAAELVNYSNNRGAELTLNQAIEVMRIAAISELTDQLQGLRYCVKDLCQMVNDLPDNM